MGMKLVAGPTVEPLSLSELKEQCKIQWNTEDAMLQDIYIPAARRTIEEYCDRSFVTQTWRMTLDDFPTKCGGLIKLPRCPVISVSSIYYTATDGTSTLYSSSNYRVQTDDEPCRVMPAYGTIWPATRGDIGNVIITYTAGYGANGTYTPKPLKQAIAYLAAQWCKSREPVTNELANTVPYTLEWLISPFKAGQYV